MIRNVSTRLPARLAHELELFAPGSCRKAVVLEFRILPFKMVN
jgi:hypothetical protein